MIRQKTIHCGKGTKTYYREVDITMYKNTPRQRGKKRKHLRALWGCWRRAA